MRVLSVRVCNFGCVRDERIAMEQLTAFIGPNGSGKSTLLRAIEIFFDSTPALSSDDYYAAKTNEPITIELTLDMLREDECQRFGAYVQDGRVVIERRFEFANGKPISSLHGQILRHAAFAPIRGSEGAAQVKEQYKLLREQPEYAELPPVTKVADALNALATWELAHPDQCGIDWDDGSFFSLRRDAQGFLCAHTTVIRLPAIRDAVDEASEGKGAAITTLMDRAVRRAVVAHAEFAQIQAEAAARYTAVLTEVKATDLRTLERDLGAALRTFVPTARLELDWYGDSNIEFAPPQAVVRINEDAYGATIERCGHGVQRAFVLALLQQEAASGAAGAPGDLIVLLEEPELFQHPSRQRHFSAVLRKLAIVSPGGSVQVVITTHSPLFVSLEHFHEIRLVRKVIGPSEDAPFVSKISASTLAQVAQRYALARGEATLSPSALTARLLAISSPMTSEGFFAQTVVLVEGESDHAALAAMAAHVGFDLSAQGVVVVVVGGKTNLALHLIAFESLSIPVYVVWDSDQGKPEDARDVNKALLRLRERAVVDFPSEVQHRHACFLVDLEAQLEQDIGHQAFGALLAGVQHEFGMSLRRKDILKSHMLMRKLVERANQQGGSTTSLLSIVEKIRALHETELAVATVAAPAHTPTP